MVVRNGIRDTSLAPVPGEPGAFLRADAAASWERLCDDVERRYGWRPRLTSAGDAFRSYEVQERIFRQRYTPTGPTAVDRVGKAWDGNGNGVPESWWRLPVYATAATPGTSNHGWGVACDVTGLGGFTGVRYRQFATVAAAHGWDNVEGRSIGEPWHWRYRPENDRHALTLVNNPGIGVPTVDVPTVIPGQLAPILEDLMKNPCLIVTNQQGEDIWFFDLAHYTSEQITSLDYLNVVADLHDIDPADFKPMNAADITNAITWIDAHHKRINA